ncbi:MAG: hemerythrin domain-containing protein [Caulobacteraceae bacterium]|nr:hemerythrin domain-containing protein [Caulobacteraceae bacterium]
MDQRAILAPRRALITAAAAGAVLGLAGCGKNDAKGEDVSATEDLMREHGVLRRILVVYRETAAFVRANFSGVDGRQIWRAADLFRRFGQAYHEQQLEEAHIFPGALKAGGEAAALVPVLIAQHARGRQITGYIQAKTAGGAIAGADAGALAEALESFARMYEPHAAYEDTIVFQAWRASLSKQQLAEAAEQFEDIEKTAFHGDGFDLAVREIEDIEKALRVHGLARYTAPAPGAADAGVLPTPQTEEGAD